MADITFHYPPELFNLLVDVIPLLNRSKKDVLIFFRGCGIAETLFADISDRVATAPGGIHKYEIVRAILERVNAKGEPTLRERREILKRIVEFTNFDSCWPNDQLKAKGLVSSIRDVVNQKDTFTRINQERELERRQRVSQEQAANQKRQERIAQIDSAKAALYSLFGTSNNPQRRGKELEAAVNSIFSAYGILVREAFHLVGEAGEGIVEQIDGVIELKGALYFVELKWYQEPVGKPQISEHLVRLMCRAEARGLIISASDYTDPAIHTASEFLQHKVVALVHLREIVQVLERRLELGDLLIEKANAAQIHKNPYFRPLESGNF
jgi:restriction system protein